MVDKEPANGRTDSEKLHFAEQKAMCDNQYYTDFAHKSQIDALAFWGKWLLGGAFVLAIGAFIYTFTISNILAKDIAAGDMIMAAQVDAAQLDRSNIRIDLATQQVRYEAIKESLDKIEREVVKLAAEKHGVARD